MFLGKLKRSEEIPITLTLDAAPTGTPQYRLLLSDHTEHVAAANLSGSGLNWYKAAQNVGSSDAVGSYLVEYTAVIDGVTRYAYDSYEVTVNEIDDVKTETALIKTETDKIQTIDDNVDTSLTNQTSIEGKIDTIDAVVDLIKPETDKMQTVDDNVDQLLLDVAALPTAAEIDTELTTAHGAGTWTASSSGSGAYSIVFNVKDQSANPIMGAYVTVHNSNDDDSPLLAWDTATDSNGDTETLNIDGAIKVRVKAANFNYTTSSHTISASGTVNITGTASTASNPGDPDVCRLRIYPITLGDVDITDLADNLIISSEDALQKVNGQFIKNTTATFTYDAATTPDSYYFDAVRGSGVHITCDLLGIDHDLTVPDLATKDLTDLIQ